jgi:hypothetical protein
MSESKAVKRRIADGSLSMDDVNRLRDKDIAFDKLLGVAAKRGATVDKEVQRGYGVSQLKNGTVNWTPSQDMGASKYFMGGRGQDPMMAALGETPGPRAGKGWVATGEHEKGGTTYSFYGDPAYVQKRKDKERAVKTETTEAEVPAAPAAPVTPAEPAPVVPAFDLEQFRMPSFASAGRDRYQPFESADSWGGLSSQGVDDRVQASEDTTRASGDYQFDGDRHRRGRYSPSGMRFAGSIFNEPDQ